MVYVEHARQAREATKVVAPLCPIGRFPERTRQRALQGMRHGDMQIDDGQQRPIHAAALPKEVGKKSVSDAKAPSTLGVSDYALYMYAALASTSAMALMAHRRCPSGFKTLDFFADKHKIEDTLGAALLGDAIGAAFTVVLVMAVAGIFVMITDPRNDKMSTGGIVPITPVMRSGSGYGTISLSLTPFAPRTRRQMRRH